MIKKIMLILLCLIILFPAIGSAEEEGEATKLEIGEKVRIFNGAWIHIKSLNSEDEPKYIGYKGLFVNSGRLYVKFTQYYINQEFHPIIYDTQIKIMCIGMYGFEPLDIQAQYIRLKFLGDCSTVIYPETKNNELEEEKKEKINKPVMIKK